MEATPWAIPPPMLGLAGVTERRTKRCYLASTRTYRSGSPPGSRFPTCTVSDAERTASKILR